MHQIQPWDIGWTPEVKIGYIGGGSRGWAHILINDVLQCEDIAGEVGPL